MKLDATAVRYLDDHTFRVLSAVEQGSKNHEIVPTPLIAQLSHSRSGGVNKALGELAKRNLVSKEQNAKYAGYRLTYGGYDYLACRTFSRRGTIYSVGNQIGTGKESDIYVVADEDGKSYVLKIHRLGRLSFRSIKSKRDYLRQDQSTSWMYMSRLAAIREFSFMNALYESGFPVPKPIDQNRHCIVMELIDSFPMRQVESIPEPGRLYQMLLDLLIQLAKSGLVHGDFNEFNILLKDDRDDDDFDDDEKENRVDETYNDNKELANNPNLTQSDQHNDKQGEEENKEKEEGEDEEEEEEEDEYPLHPVLIDFPQMLSVEHPDAEECFDRDVECLRGFFKRRFRYEPPEGPTFQDVKKMISNDAAIKNDKDGLHVLFETALQLQDLPKRERVFAEERRHQENLDDINQMASSDDNKSETNYESEASGQSEDSEDDDASSSNSSSNIANDDDMKKPSLQSKSNGKTPIKYQYTRRGLAPAKTNKRERHNVTEEEVATLVAQSLAQRKKSDQRRHHGSKSAVARALGRQKGSKKKTDKRAQLETFF